MIHELFLVSFLLVLFSYSVFLRISDWTLMQPLPPHVVINWSGACTLFPMTWFHYLTMNVCFDFLKILDLTSFCVDVSWIRNSKFSTRANLLAVIFKLTARWRENSKCTSLGRPTLPNDVFARVPLCPSGIRQCRLEQSRLITSQLWDCWQFEELGCCVCLNPIKCSITWSHFRRKLRPLFVRSCY